MSNNLSTKYRTDLRLGRGVNNLSSLTYQFIDFIHLMVFYFYFNGVTVKTGIAFNHSCRKHENVVLRKSLP